MRYLFPLIFTLALGSSTLSQSIVQCDIALGKEVRSLDITTMSGHQLTVVSNFMASMSYEQVRAGGFLGIGKFLAGGDYSKATHNSFRSNHFKNHGFSFEYKRFRSVVPPAAFAAWSQCVRDVLNQVLRVELKTGGNPKDVILEVSWKPVGSLVPLHVQGVGATNLSPHKYASRLFADGFFVPVNQVKKFILQRKDVDRSALAIIHTSYGDREGEVPGHVVPHDAVKKWMRESVAGKPYKQTFVFNGPDRHNKPGKTIHKTEKLTVAGPEVRIWDVDYACVSGPAGHTTAPRNHRPKGEYGSSFRIVGDGCSFTWGRRFASGPTVIHHTAKYEVYREVCATNCKAKGAHRR